MVQFAYAAARTRYSDPVSPVRQAMQGAAPRRAQPTRGSGFELARRVLVALAAALALALIGGVAARALDSNLLGFVFADLVFLVAVALRSAVSSPSRGSSRQR